MVKIHGCLSARNPHVPPNPAHPATARAAAAFQTACKSLKNYTKRREIQM